MNTHQCIAADTEKKPCPAAMISMQYFLIPLVLFFSLSIVACSNNNPKGSVHESTDTGAVSTANRPTFYELMPLAEQGNAEAQYNLGLAYEKGYGTTKNYREALKWYTLAAGQKHALAQFSLGFLHTNGLGVPQDYRQELKWYTLAANQGYAEAQFRLGAMHYTGRGVTQNYKEAMKWFTLAANQGSATAQYNLGVMHKEGFSVTQNYRQAAKWYRLAAEQGFTEAQATLGAMYAGGLGVSKDYVLAYMWLDFAVVNGAKKGTRELRDEIARGMTAQRLEKAKSLSLKCKARNYKDCEEKTIYSRENHTLFCP